MKRGKYLLLSSVIPSATGTWSWVFILGHTLVLPRTKKWDHHIPSLLIVLIYPCLRTAYVCQQLLQVWICPAAHPSLARVQAPAQLHVIRSHLRPSRCRAAYMVGCALRARRRCYSLPLAVYWCYDEKWACSNGWTRSIQYLPMSPILPQLSSDEMLFSDDL